MAPLDCLKGMDKDNPFPALEVMIVELDVGSASRMEMDDSLYPSHTSDDFNRLYFSFSAGFYSFGRYHPQSLRSATQGRAGHAVMCAIISAVLCIPCGIGHHSKTRGAFTLFAFQRTFTRNGGRY